MLDKVGLTIVTGDIAADAVTYAKIQNVSATDKVLGRSTAGAGDVEEIACTAAARSVLDDATVAAMVDTLGGAAASGTGGIVRATAPTITTSLTLADAANIIANATTGTKIGTATTQKLSLWNKNPDAQPTTAITAAAFVANTSGIANDTATFGGYTIGQIAAALIRIGALA